MDPFHANRSRDYLGVCFERQAKCSWWRLVKSTPDGPVILANLSDGFCGQSVMNVTRLPLRRAVKAGWSVLLSVLHSDDPQSGQFTSRKLTEKAVTTVIELENATSTTIGASQGPDWDFLADSALFRHQAHACINISRTTLITALCVTNARMVFQYTDAAGFRAGYGSYCGQ